MRLWKSWSRRPPDPRAGDTPRPSPAADPPASSLGLKPADAHWGEAELLGFLLGLERVDLALTEEQARAAADYARSHARRFALVLGAFAGLIPPGARIFSMGSMPNHLELVLARFLGATVIGSTYSPADSRDKFTAVYRAPDGARLEMDVYLRDLTRDPIPLATGSCDAVLCFEMVEHLTESPLPALREARRVLRPDGHVLMSTPNMQYWRRVLYMINGLTYPDVDFREPIESRHTHIFSLRELRELLAASGFTVAQHFFVDPWQSEHPLDELDLRDPLNRAVRDALAARDEYRSECVFIAARPAHLVLVLRDGWHPPEHEGDDWWSWTSGRGRIGLLADRAGPGMVCAELDSVLRPNRVEISINGVLCQAVDMGEEGRRQVAFETGLAAGENIVEFASQRAGIPLPTDSRRLAIAVRNLTITADGGVYHLLGR
jgi:SAM-dependent methyltransferase